MKLFLFGGAEIQLGQFIPQLELIEKVILEIKPKQILHIPFARTKAKEIERELGRFTKNIHLDGIEYLNATNEEDIVKAENPLIFISGGGENMNLVHKIQENPTLRNLVQHAEYIIGESAGTKVLGAYLRELGNDPNSKLLEGLNIIKDTVIEPHYTERDRHGLLLQDMEKANLTYGIGIDCVTAIVFDLDKFPNEYTTIGDGLVEIKMNSKK